MSKTQSKARIERGNTYLVVPHANAESRFVYPAQGPNTYKEVGKVILANDSRLADGAQTASLLHEAYCSDDKEFKESPEANFIRKNIMKKGYLWVFNRNFWTPKNAKNAGVYVQFDEQAKGMSQILQISQLEDILSGGTIERGVRFSKDGKTAFAPYNTMNAGTHDKGTLAQNGFVIASYGAEGAEKLDSVAKTFTSKPYVWLMDNTGKDAVQSLSALGRYWDDDGRLDVGGDVDGGGRGGFAFGVRGSAEGSAPKK